MTPPPENPPEPRITFPFSAVVGQDDVKLGLLLCAVDPRIGGVLLRGQKGSAKSTLARAVAALMPGDAPFVELPVGATEDRLVGSIDLQAALTEGRRRFHPGLLAAAHGGVLYVDEVNLLPDHLVDVLLDVAASGVNRVEREGISEAHPSRFVLVGSMNPEEGELRPQLLDRFGLAVDVTASTVPAQRAEAVRRRLAFDADPSSLRTEWAAEEQRLRDRLTAATPAAVAPQLVETISALCASVGAEGLRADLVITRAAAALAGWEGRTETTVEDVRRVAPLALAHRRRRSPFEEPGIGDDEIEEALNDAARGPGDGEPGDGEPGDGEPGDGESEPGQQERIAAPDAPTPVIPLQGGPAGAVSSPSAGRRSTAEGQRGRLVGDRAPDGPMGPVALGATVRAAAARRGLSPDKERGGVMVEASDLREAVRAQRVGNLVVLAVDASGSMGAERRMEAVKGAVIGLLLDAYQRRDRVALVMFRGEGAEVALRPTGSVEVARARLEQLPTGGRTPLAAGLRAALEVAAAASSGPHQPLLVVVSDGRATAAPDGTDPVEAAIHAATAVRHQGVASVVVDAETGPTRLGLARTIAEAMGARYLTLPELTATTLVSAVRRAAGG
ncbi:MAG: AAA family ATPase [Thermoleophilaceae bacterium]|nr:AAA family ATPase [Thermoleophilaceae bacterium]